ncbi:DinB family protein [Sporocytophaga myxococcoides]|uniref:DinB family protein n=1 Tax=Sporocytophaga myxococcoides TaxID=153721 RepID=UPI0004215E41|nr:DinB family protein [Sporocytophaga myxococcoides]
MNKSEINPMPDFFDRYIDLVEEPDLLTAMKLSIQNLKTLDVSFLKNIGDRVYAPGKWTIKQIIQHIIDNERIQSYRALRFSRKDETVLPGYDEALLASNADTTNRTIEDMLEELIVVRQSSILLFKSFSEDMYLSKGICFNREISALGLGFVIVGHEAHHFNVIKERYYPLFK